jgi:hypothetical protein
MEGPSPLASYGLPDGLARFEATGQAVSPTDLDAELRNPLQRPADRQVVRFLP